MWYEELETAGNHDLGRKNLHNEKSHALQLAINCRSSDGRCFNLPTNTIEARLFFNCNWLSHLKMHNKVARDWNKNHTECVQNSPSNVCFSTCELSRYICNCSFCGYLVFPSHKVNDDDDAWSNDNFFRFNDSVTHFSRAFNNALQEWWCRRWIKFFIVGKNEMRTCVNKELFFDGVLGGRGVGEKKYEYCEVWGSFQVLFMKFMKIFWKWDECQ